MEYITKLPGTLVYVQLQTPQDCWDKDKGKEWKCSVVVDEDTADEWNEQFPKQLAKPIKTSDFASIYKCEAPLPDEKKQYVITLRKNIKLGNGNLVPDMYKPKVLLGLKELEDVTTSVEVGNGSQGIMSVDLWDSPKGMVARLKNVVVTDLVEYEGTEYKPGSEFSEDESAAEKPKAEKPKAKPKAQVKPKVKPEAEPEDDTPEDDDPF